MTEILKYATTILFSSCSLVSDLKAQTGDNVVKAYPWIAILVAAFFTLAF